MPGLWEKLEQVKKYRWVDLTHTLTNQKPVLGWDSKWIRGAVRSSGAV